MCVSPVWGYNITVDKNGVMRRSDNGAEVSFYGANYTVPFAHAYRALESLGIDHKRAIDRDVYHFSRLGLDAFRIHVWDVEIADSEGKLNSLFRGTHVDVEIIVKSLDVIEIIKGIYGMIVPWEELEPVDGTITEVTE